jgi:hypothetical protein
MHTTMTRVELANADNALSTPTIHLNESAPRFSRAEGAYYAPETYDLPVTGYYGFVKIVWTDRTLTVHAQQQQQGRYRLAW